MKTSSYNYLNKYHLCFVIFLHLINHKKLEHDAPDKATGTNHNHTTSKRY